MEKNWTDHVQLGQYKLKNRVVLAAMTRQRCDPSTGIPNDQLVDYYSQRSNAGLILTQCVAWSQRGEAFPGVANLYNRQQAQGWKKVVDAVHQKGGLIYVQIFHGGLSCLTITTITTRGLQPQAPSAIRLRDMHHFEKRQYQVPHEMTLQDIQRNKRQWRNTVQLAKEVGFDGIQLHGAHGYLIDTFLKSWSNKRTDLYGVSAQNRCRFAIQLIDIVLQYFEPYQVGIKVSPVSRYGDMYDENPLETYTKLAQLLQERKIGFIEVRQSTQPVNSKQQFPTTPIEQIPDVCAALRPFFTGLLIANQQMTPQNGLAKINSGNADLVSFEDYLAKRIIENKDLNPQIDWMNVMRGPNKTNSEAKGYSDYPFYQQWKAKQLQEQVQKIKV